MLLLFVQVFKPFFLLIVMFVNARARTHTHTHTQAGQYVGITADNSANLQSADLQFGNGSLIQDDGQVNLETARYYQRLYGMLYI